MGIIAVLITELFEPKAVTPIAVRKSSGAVKRRFDPLWKERNWNKIGTTYKGYFRTRYGSYKGEIVERSGSFFQFFISNPPSCLARHSHSQCFIPRGGRIYEVHFSKKAKTPDEGIMAIEKILREAHQLR